MSRVNAGIAARLVFSLLLSVALAAQQTTTLAAQQRPLAVVGGMLLDGYGGPPLKDAVIIIQGERIQTVGTLGQVRLPQGARVVDAEGKTVMPGLIDVHVHLSYLGQNQSVPFPQPYADRLGELVLPLAAKQLLSVGVTTARDPYIGLEEGIRMKRLIERGEAVGPRLFISGPALTGGRGAEYRTMFEWGVSDENDARAKVRRLAEAGVDLVKILNADRIDPPVLQTIVDEARAKGLRFTSHAFETEEIRRALQAGVGCFEHLDLATSPAYPAELVERFRERNMRLYWVPTLVADHTYLGSETYPERLDDPRLGRFLPPELWSSIRKSLPPPSTSPWANRVRRNRAFVPVKFRQLKESGVTLLVGSDSGTEFNFHVEATWREMWLWQALGVEPMEIIQAATYWPARYLRQPDLGVVEAGKLADLIVVDGNPLESLRDMRNVDAVIKGGKVFVEDGKWVGP
jgi:imidazolonepropionase-like amidohydrolase